MADPRVKSQVGATPGKMVLIAVLAVVFVSVLVFQFTATEEPPVPRENADASGNSESRPAENGSSVPTSPPDKGDLPKPDRQKPEIALEEVLLHDPFAVPAVLLPPTGPSSADTAHGVPDKVRREELRRKREQVLAAIREEGVQMVFLGKDGQAAIIGDRRVSIGDIFKGFRVTGIGSDGVTLSEQE